MRDLRHLECLQPDLSPAEGCHHRHPPAWPNELVFHPLKTLAAKSGGAGGMRHAATKRQSRAYHLLHSQEGGTALVVSLTQVHVPRALPFAAAVAAQKHRVKKLKKQGRVYCVRPFDLCPPSIPAGRSSCPTTIHISGLKRSRARAFRPGRGATHEDIIALRFGCELRRRPQCTGHVLRAKRQHPRRAARLTSTRTPRGIFTSATGPGGGQSTMALLTRCAAPFCAAPWPDYGSGGDRSMRGAPTASPP
jgi:hypothetical protein